MVRLVFRPYTQVWRSICTSESLRTSTRVSSGFVLLGHSSPSFGSQRVRSRAASPTSRQRRAGSAPPAQTAGGSYPVRRRSAGLCFHFASGFRNTHWLAHMLDSLVRVSRRVGQVTDRFATDPESTPTARRRRTSAVSGHWRQSPQVERTNGSPEPTPTARRGLPRSVDGPTPSGAVTPTRASGRGHLLRGLFAADEPVVALRPPKMHTPPRAARTRRTPCGCRRRARREAGELNPTDGLCGPLRLPLNGFTYCWTLSSKFFSTFPHGTCSLSDSRPYLALDGVYHQLWAAFSNNPTPRTWRARRAVAVEGWHPLWQAPIRRTRTPSRRASARPKHHSSRRPTACDSVLGSSHFTRRYCGNPGWFLFLRLLICLNSAGNLVRSQVEERIFYTVNGSASLPPRTAAPTHGDDNAEEIDRVAVPSVGLRTCGRPRQRQNRLHLGRRETANRDRPFRDDPTRRREEDDRRSILSTDPETGVASGLPEAAMCVQDIDAQCVLQFTLIHAAGCALHRLASRVIHRLELYHR